MPRFNRGTTEFLMAGASISVLGQQMLGIVVAWDLYRITHSAIALGNVGLARDSSGFSLHLHHRPRCGSL